MLRKFLNTLMILCFLSSVAIGQDAQVKSDEPRLNTASITVYGLAPVAVYERILPFGDNFGAIASAGLFFYGSDTYGYSLGATFYVGTDKHKGELGAVYLNEVLPIAYGSYRYTNASGLFAKGGLGYTFMDDGEEGGVVPILAIGYAF